MRTVREAKRPSQRLGMFNYQPDRHYVVVQKPGPDWPEDTVSQYLFTFDPATGQPAYKIEADGSVGDGALYTGKANAVLMSCSKAFSDKRVREAVARSKQMKDADFTLGQFEGGAEWTPDKMPEVETTIGDAMNVAKQFALQRQGDLEEFGNPELANQ